MKILFIGVGLTDYINQQLNKLNKEQGIDIYNLVDANGVGHIPAGTHQSRKGIDFKVIELPGIVCRKYSDWSYWSFGNLAEALQDIKPDIVVVSERYVRGFMYDSKVASVSRKLGIKFILKDNPWALERYEIKKGKILRGLCDAEYTPFYVLYFIRLFERLGLKDSSTLKHVTLGVLRAVGLNTSGRVRSILLKRLEEKKHILNFVGACASYIEEAYELYGSYGVPREKIFILYNSPDTDILFAIREKIEQEPPVLPYSPHRVIHVGRLVPWKRVDMLIEAVGELKKEFSDAELLVIGYGPQEAELKALARERGLEARVKFIGGVYDQALLGKYFLASGVYVLAGMGGLSINDGMTFGRPIVCSVGDGTEKKLVYEGENGRYFKNGDRADLVKKLQFLFKNPELLKKMGERSTEIIKTKINIHTVINGYRQAFDYVLKLQR
ncbi:MAG: glycosyltransferase family 4 protein [bacterium]|nr:glycosyltransferase family 4 protein [bacterium]